jgi:ribonuclease J
MVNRIQQAFDAAAKYGRKIAISGRSLEKYIDEAMRLGFLKVPAGTVIDLRTAHRIPDTQLVYLTTGSQGEEYSALSRISSGEHRHIQVKRGDTVVISASIIPGNEASVFEVVNNLYKQGAQVIYGKQVDIHVSGHANEEELKMLLALSRPEHFMPIHGEFRHLVKHGRVAERLGVDPNKIFILENGGVIEFDENGVGSISNERVQAGQVLVDGLGVGDVGNIVLRDRQAMAKDGIFVVILTVDKQSGALTTSPDIISRGFVYMRAAEDLIHKSRQEVKRMFIAHNAKYPMNYDYIRRMIRDEMGEYLFEYTQRRPMIIPVIIEV